MKAHIGVDRETKLIHSVAATAADVADARLLPDLLRGKETAMWGDQAYQGHGAAILERAPGAEYRVDWRWRTKLRCYPQTARAQPGPVQDPLAHRACICHPQAPLRLHQGALPRPGQNTLGLLATCALVNLLVARKPLLEGCAPLSA